MPFIFYALLIVACVTCCRAQVIVTVDTTLRFQTIQGWGHGSQFLGAGWSLIPEVNEQYVDFLADDWGLTGTRLSEVGPRPDGSASDDGDCDSLDWSRFVPGPPGYLELMARFAAHIRAAGYKPSFYSSPGYASLAAFQKPWVLYHPGERAQQIWASARYLRDRYGIDVDYAAITNEPSGKWTLQVIAEDVKALGPRLREHGLTTRIQFPECVTPRSSWEMVSASMDDTAMWSYIGRISYHNYGEADPWRSYLRDFGRLRDVPTAQTEMDPAAVDDLFNDLELGGITYWEVSYSGSNTVQPNPGYTSFTPSRYYYRIRQITHYVRPGAWRVGTATNDTNIRALAFRQGDSLVVVLNNSARIDKSVVVRGIPPGRYGISQAAPAAPGFTERGVFEVVDSVIAVNVIPPGNVVTIYPRREMNAEPTLMFWGSDPGIIEPPANISTLYVSANDPDRDSLRYGWRIVSMPPGANASIQFPSSARTNVGGLNVDGKYVFHIDVTDGRDTTGQDVYLVRFAGNQPPRLNYTGFRLAAPYGVVLDVPDSNSTPLRTTISLPTSSCVLQANVGDIEMDSLIGDWKIVSQPQGAAAAISATSYIYLSFRATVSRMTVPGDYTFEVAVRDRWNSPVRARVICNVADTNRPPVIRSMSATPSVPTLADGAAELVAETFDSNAETLRHWWVVKSAPTGVTPIFEHQGRARTIVRGLAAPGEYVFTVRTFDGINMVVRDLRVVVQERLGVPPEYARVGLTVVPNPASDDATVTLPSVRPGPLVLDLIDVLGRRVATVFDAELSTGDRAVALDLRSVSVGCYRLRVRGADGVHVAPLIVRR